MLISPPNLGDTAKNPDLLRQVLDQWFLALTERLRAESPAGIVVAWVGLAVPEGWIECDGAEYENTKYEELYRAIGTTWGGTATTFRVPTQADLGGAPGSGTWIIRVGT